MKKFLRKWAERRQFRRDYNAWRIVSNSKYPISDFIREVAKESKQ